MICVNIRLWASHVSCCVLQLLAVFMKLDTRLLLINYIDLTRSRNVQLTFDALLVGMWKHTFSLFSIGTLSPLVSESLK